MRWPNGSQSRPSISSPFGPRRAPCAGCSTFHRGVDFVGFSSVRAVAGGFVRVVGTPSGWSGGGRQVWIQHDGFFTRSLHLASTAVRNGQRVNAGDIIGTMGATGNVTGVHLHLELQSGALHYGNTGQVDPVPFIAARITQGNWPARARYGEAHVIRGQDGLIRLGYELGSYGADGKDGPATQGAVRDFQGKNGLTVDGILGPDTLAAIERALAHGNGENRTDRPTADIQRLVGAMVDGIWGPETTAKVKAWQAANGLTADGIWGPASDAVGFPPTGYVPVTVDGDWGPATTRALQASLGVAVDGELGPETWRAVQVATGNPTVDGILGPDTRRYLQASLGVAVDGIIGYDSVVALQRLLNAGGKLQPATVPPAEPDPAPTPVPDRPAVATYPGAAWWHHSPNSSVRDSEIDLFIIHHTTETGSVLNVRDYMMRKNDRNVSANWLIAQDGEVYEIVPPDDYRAWTSGAIDHRAVTVETMNVTGAPSWGISEASHEAIAQLVAWANHRWGIPLDRAHIIGHREVPGAATACPGPSMDLDWIVARAIELNSPEPDPSPDLVEVPRVELEALRDAVEGWLA